MAEGPDSHPPKGHTRRSIPARNLSGTRDGWGSDPMIRAPFFLYDLTGPDRP